jgi:hypothetical protein
MYFIEERMNIFWKKYGGFPKPYTDDEIMQKHKFTNVYRVLDRSSQYLLKNVIYNGKNYSKGEMIWRIIMYKHFNLPSTWDALLNRFGDVTLNISSKDFCEFFDVYKQDHILYSNAYMITASFMRSKPIMESFNLIPGMPKYESYLRLFDIGLFEDRIMDELVGMNSLEEGFNSLKKIVGIADFLAYQLVQDINYTDIFDFDDNDFCAAGPGTQRGIERCFTIVGKSDYQEIVKWVQINFEQLCEDYKINFKSLPNWKPKVPDFSSCFCETSKYLKGMNPGIVDGDKRIKQLFKENDSKIDFIFPPKWNIKL